MTDLIRSPHRLVLVTLSGAKRQIPQPSRVKAMTEAETAMRRYGRQLREVRVLSGSKCVARWKAELRWRQVGGAPDMTLRDAL